MIFPRESFFRKSEKYYISVAQLGGSRTLMNVFVGMKILMREERAMLLLLSFAVLSMVVLLNLDFIISFSLIFIFVLSYTVCDTPSARNSAIYSVQRLPSSNMYEFHFHAGDIWCRGQCEIFRPLRLWRTAEGIIILNSKQVGMYAVL